MKKYILMGGVFLFAFALSASFTFAAVNAITPSTNDINRTNGWAHVDVSAGVGELAVDFIQPRAFFSCFEYRTDGDTSQRLTTNGGNNYNTLVTDGLYPYKCLSTINTFPETITANQYVEVRMVFGAETDERFDWTRFDVLPTPVPTNKDECKKDGWKTFGVFKNQGDCVSFVATGGKNLPANQ